MRGWLLEHAGAVGLQVFERDLTEADILGADELWISNAVGGVRRVASVDGREWRSWSFFERLIRLGVPAPGW
jgi:branched-subunit amino acid aminotransferase/4-amino-4-deoxychorismate lyase